MQRDFFLNTILLGGTTAEKIDAAASAGFQQIELWREDVEAFAPGPAALARLLRERSLGLTDYQVLRDFDGASDGQRAGRREAALQMLDTALVLGSGTVQLPSNTRDDVLAERIPEDLAWLGEQAAARGLRLAYEPMAWSTVNHTLPALWASVRASGATNIGVVVDAFHIFSRERTVADLDGIPPERIANVQFCDCDRRLRPDEIVDTARHRRLLPGQGIYPLRALLQRLDGMGYAGPLGIEVFNDVLKARPAREVASEAMVALVALLEG